MHMAVVVFSVACITSTSLSNKTLFVLSESPSTILNLGAFLKFAGKIINVQLPGRREAGFVS